MNADQVPVPSGGSTLPPGAVSTPPSLGVHKVPGKPEDHVVEVVHEVTDQEVPPEEEPEALHETVKTLLVGKPLSLDDKKIFSHISLIALFAWVGLGADGLSSSCYGPEEAFRALYSTEHLVLAERRGIPDVVVNDVEVAPGAGFALAAGQPELGQVADRTRNRGRRDLQPLGQFRAGHLSGVAGQQRDEDPGRHSRPPGVRQHVGEALDEALHFGFVAGCLVGHSTKCT